MGEVAEMMLDGTLCESCGAYVGPAVGFPLKCDDCSRPRSVRVKDKVACPACGKKVKKTGLVDHQRDAHGNSQSNRTKAP